MAITALNENWDKHRTKTYGGGTLWPSISLRSSLWTLRSSPRRHRIFALHEAIPLLHVEQALSPGVVEWSEQLYTIHIYIICCLCCVYVYNIYIIYTNQIKYKYIIPCVGFIPVCLLVWVPSAPLWECSSTNPVAMEKFGKC